MPLQDEMPLDSDGPRRRHPEEWQRSLDVDILLSTMLIQHGVNALPWDAKITSTLTVIESE